MNKKLTAITLVAITLGMVATTSAQDTSSSNEVTANVTSTVAMDVKPETLSYPDLTVGQVSTESNRSYGGVSIANTGSEYIDQIWLETSYPDTRPFGTGDPTAYNAGNFMTVKPESRDDIATQGDNETYHFVNRKEFEDSNYPNFIRTEPTDADGGDIGSNDVSDHQVGQFRFGDEWFYYDIPTGADDQCNGAGANSPDVIRIGQTSHTQSEDGTVDFRNDGTAGLDDYQEYSLSTTGTDAYGVTNNSVEFDFRSGNNQTYDILTACTGNTGVSEPHVVLNRYNVDFNQTSDLTSTGSISNYILDASAADAMLKPDQKFSVETAMNVPRGVSAGQVGAGSLTVYATADVDAQQ